MSITWDVVLVQSESLVFVYFQHQQQQIQIYGYSPLCSSLDFFKPYNIFISPFLFCYVPSMDPKGDDIKDTDEIEDFDDLEYDDDVEPFYEGMLVPEIEQLLTRLLTKKKKLSAQKKAIEKRRNLIKKKRDYINSRIAKIQSRMEERKSRSRGSK